LLVILELIWVLESAYKIDRDDLLDSLDQLILMPIFEFEHLSAIQNFILDAKTSNLDLSDLLIAHSSHQAISLPTSQSVPHSGADICGV